VALIYALFLSRIPNISYLVPQSLPEVLFMLITFCFGGMLCIVINKVYLVYLPSEKSVVMRIRAILIIVSNFAALAFFLVKIAIAGGYFWPILSSQTLINLSFALLVLSALLHFSALLSNKIYVRFVVISRNIQCWSTFQDLKYLIGHLLRLCPEVGLPATNTSYLKFLLNPEYHLYRALVTILDGKTMLSDFLSEDAPTAGPALWDGELLQEAVRVNEALQSINPSGDFWNMVSEYGRASRGLMQSRHPNNALEGVQ